VLTAATVKQFVSHMVGASNKYASIETKKVKKLRSWNAPPLVPKT
jgi:hypothetical protein